VATAQTDALVHERTSVQLEGARLTASVNLIKALGSGWQPVEIGQSSVKPSTKPSTISSITE
jgi:outer membrane protein TolC